MKDKRSNRRRAALAILCAALAICSAAVFPGCGKGGGTLRLGTAGVGGNYYSFGQAFGQFLEQDLEGTEVDVKATAGSAANLRLLQDKGRYLDLAIAQSDVISDDMAANSGSVGYRAIAGLYTEACQVVTLADSGIKTVRSLRGRIVSIGEKESGSEKNARQIMHAYGLSEDMYEAKNMSYAEAAEALKNGQIDAFFCTAGVQTTIVEELAKQAAVRLLPVDGPEGEALTDTYKYFVRYVIPAGTYTGQAADVKTLGVKSVLLARKDLSADRVKAVTRCLFDHVNDLEYSVSVHFELDKEEAVKDIPVELHDGAKEWYEGK